MSEEPQVSLRDHFEKQIEWVEQYFDRRLEDAKESVKKAEDQLNQRLESMNELRAQLKDQASTFITRIEHEEFGKRIAELERHDATSEGRSKATAVYWSIGASVLTALIVLVLSKVLIK